ncbi:hypothetical protein ABZ345_46980 [Lentzea sp. NPDC005914]|uniref:hypothetical protein n=1 Tax=Lentzea sp. NPDC005914 TaxID=3154572 RepID=UPI0033D2051C
MCALLPASVAHRPPQRAPVVSRRFQNRRPVTRDRGVIDASTEIPLHERKVEQMRALGVASVVAVAITAGLGGIVLPAASAAAATNDVGIAACTYVVRYDGLAVRENPSPNSEVRKYKEYGSIVNGPCANHQHSSGEWYTAVYCSCATDGEGWMRTVYLDRVA